MQTTNLPAHEVAARKQRAANDTPKTGSNEKRVLTRAKAKPTPAAKRGPRRSADGRFMPARRSAAE